MPDNWDLPPSSTTRGRRTNRKSFRGDADGRVNTATPVAPFDRSRRSIPSTFKVYVQPDEPTDVTEIGTLWFDTDEPVPPGA